MSDKRDSFLIHRQDYQRCLSKKHACTNTSRYWQVSILQLHCRSRSTSTGLNGCRSKLFCRIVNSESVVEFQPSPFFAEQLTAFELWLQHGSKDKKPPEQLPIVLQVGRMPLGKIWDTAKVSRGCAVSESANIKTL